MSDPRLRSPTQILTRVSDAIYETPCYELGKEDGSTWIVVEREDEAEDKETTR